MGVCQVVGRVEEQVKESLPEVAGVPCIGVSALTGAGAGEVLPTALQAFRVWNQRVPTARLNRWLIKAGSLSSTVLPVLSITACRGSACSLQWTRGGCYDPDLCAYLGGMSLNRCL